MNILETIMIISGLITISVLGGGILIFCALGFIGITKDLWFYAKREETLEGKLAPFGAIVLMWSGFVFFVSVLAYALSK